MGLHGFYTDLNTCIVDNLANAHIWYIKRDFIPETLVPVQKSDSSGVVTIRWVELNPYLMGDVKTSWKNND